MFKYIFSGVLVALMGVMYVFGFHNVSTPAGYVGYVTQNEVFGQTHYVGLQQGPTSTGLGFLIHAENVSVTPYTYDENFTITANGDEAVVAHDKLKVQFSVHVVWHVKSDGVKDYVEHYAVISPDGGDNPDDVALRTYSNFVSPVMRTFAREEIEHFDGLELKDHMGDIAKNVTTRIQEYVMNTPFEITAINVGAIQPPKEVTDEISKVQSMNQQITQKDQEIEIHEAAKNGRIAEAKGIQESMQDLNSKLTPEYLAWEAIKAQKAMAGAPNHTTTYITKGFPVTGTLPVTTPAAGK
jgi:regulator of protease activity HflC (stomatin/prohibitin superfamily)